MKEALVKHKSLRKLPVNLKETERRLFSDELEKPYFEPFYTIIHNCNLTNRLVVIKNFRIIYDDKYFNRIFQIKPWKRKVRIWLESLLNKEKICFDEGVFVVDNWSMGYFHWVTDVLPKLFSLPEKYKSYKVFLPEEYKKISFIEKSLPLIGVNEVYYFHKNQTLKFKELIIPGIMAMTGNYNDEVMKGLRKQIWKHFNLTEEPQSRIFIIRNKNIARAIINENEIIEIVTKYGFKTVCFEEKSWLEQVLLAIKCKILIGVHGAGLTNMLFMREGNDVVELRRKGDSVNNCYFSLASALSLNYSYQLCDVMNVNQTTQQSNFSINKNELEDNIKAILKIEKP